MKACGLDDFSGFEAPLKPEIVLASIVPMEALLEEWQACFDHALEQGLAELPEFVAMRAVLDRATSRAGVAPARAAEGRIPFLSRPLQRVRRLLSA